MGWVPKTSGDDLAVGDKMKAIPEVLKDGRVTIILEKCEQQSLVTCKKRAYI